MPATPTAVTQATQDTNAELAALNHALSHDVGGSIRGVSGLARILLQKHGSVLSDEAAGLVRMIDYESARSSRLVSGVLEWLSYNQRPFSFAWQDTAAVAAEAFGKARAAAASRAIEFEMRDMPPLWTDKAALFKVFYELFANAVKFTAPQPIAAIKLSAATHNGETVVTLQDNGVGFEMAHARNLFRLFRQLHRKQEFSGEGIGLAVVRHILEKQGGRIWAESSIGQGASFHFTLPPPAEEPADTGVFESHSI